MPPCGFAFTVTPNPATDNIRIETNDEVAKLNNKQASEIQAIELYDRIGVIKQKKTFAKGHTTADISVAALPNDVYTLRIFDGQAWQSCKIVVQH